MEQDCRPPDGRRRVFAAAAGFRRNRQPPGGALFAFPAKVIAAVRLPAVLLIFRRHSEAGRCFSPVFVGRPQSDTAGALCSALRQSVGRYKTALREQQPIAALALYGPRLRQKFRRQGH